MGHLFLLVYYKALVKGFTDDGVSVQHLCTFRGRKKVVISSFPDFKGIAGDICYIPKLLDLLKIL